VDSSGNHRDAIYGSATQTGQSSLKGLGSSAKTSGKLEGRITWKDDSATDGRNSLLYKLPREEFTIEAWVKPDEDFKKFTSGNRFLVVIQPEGVGFADLSLSVLADAGRYYLALGDGNGPNRVWTHTIPLEWEIGQWYHVAVTAEPVAPKQWNYKFYLGRAGDPAMATAIHSSTNTPLVGRDDLDQPRTLEIGNYYGNNGESFFPGQVDEVRISNTLRTEFETLNTPP